MTGMVQEWTGMNPPPQQAAGDQQVVAHWHGPVRMVLTVLMHTAKGNLSWQAAADVLVSMLEEGLLTHPVLVIHTMGVTMG